MNVIETLQNQMKDESSKARETEDGQSVNSSENDDSESSEMEEQEDAISMEPDSVAENKENFDANTEISKEDQTDKSLNDSSALHDSKRRKLSNDGAKAGESGGTEDHEIAKLGRLADSESTEVNVQENA